MLPECRNAIHAKITKAKARNPTVARTSNGVSIVSVSAWARAGMRETKPAIDPT